jgi:diguanylate cyclase (GGDEF)-like protein
MLKPSPAMLPRDPNPAIFVWFELIETACLALLFLVSTVQLAAWFLPGPGWIIVSKLLPMKPESAAITLLSTLCLMFLGTGQTRWKRWVSPLLAGAVILMAALVMFKYPIPYVPTQITEFASAHGVAAQVRMSLQAAGAFMVLGLTMVAMRVDNRPAVWAGDLLTLCLCVLTFTLTSDYLLGKWSLFGISSDLPTWPGTVLCLSLLTLVTGLRKTEDGIFSIYAGSGNGGKLARLLTPILLVAPFLRETTRARIIGVGVMPPQYVTALLASMAAVFSVSMLLYLVWRINEMEAEIHDLALRDELTGLHNLRGFRLLAEQAMRMAMRSKVPFSVAFIDLDGLKVINDTLGHEAGSAYISETANILRATFRETDVLGRIGGDEFAVAGQFSRKSMMATVERLKDTCARKSQEGNRQFALSLSIGYATLDETNKGTLDVLMANADEAMYEAKRLMKEQRADAREQLLQGEIAPR